MEPFRFAEPKFEQIDSETFNLKEFGMKILNVRRYGDYLESNLVRQENETPTYLISCIFSNNEYLARTEVSEVVSPLKRLKILILKIHNLDAPKYSFAKTEKLISRDVKKVELIGNGNFLQITTLTKNIIYLIHWMNSKAELLELAKFDTSKVVSNVKLVEKMVEIFYFDKNDQFFGKSIHELIHYDCNK